MGGIGCYLGHIYRPTDRQTDTQSLVIELCVVRRCSNAVMCVHIHIHPPEQQPLDIHISIHLNNNNNRQRAFLRRFFFLRSLLGLWNRAASSAE